jgi:integrase
MLEASLTLRQVADEMYFPARLTIQADDTIKQYHLAFRFYDRYLCRISRVSDLDDLELTKFKRWLFADRKLAAKTANERAGRIISMWDWLARKRLVDAFPCVEKIPEPRRAPRSWTIEQLRMIFRESLNCRGRVCGIPTSLWLRGLCGFLWNTGERIGATLRLEFEHLDCIRGSVIVPAEIRKRGQSDECYRLWPEVLEMLEEIRAYGNNLIFPTDFGKSALYHRYKKILKRANLPSGRQYMFHAMRVSHATWTQALGGNATHALRHANPATTKRHYIDGSISNQEQSILPRDFLSQPTTKEA